jgi:hypothetical protein
MAVVVVGTTTGSSSEPPQAVATRARTISEAASLRMGGA